MNEQQANPSQNAPKLLDLLRDRLRLKHYSIRTETQYVQWVRRFILFHGKRHPQEMGAKEVEAFLTHLAVEGRVAAATQNQALSALLFLYRELLHINLPWLDEVVRAKRPARLPVVLTREEEWQALADRAEAQHLTFYQQPRRRFPGTRIEHRTFFLEDPSGNLLEFKYYVHESAIFGERDYTSVGQST